MRANFWDRALVREQLRSDPVSGEPASATGFAFVIPGLAMLALDTGIRSELMSAVGLVLILPGLSLLLLGAQRTRLLALPLLIAAMMLPIPAGAIAQLHLGLRYVTAVVVEQIVPLIGPEVSREGTLLQLPHTLVSVADACSGFGTLYSSIATALILGQLVRTPRRRFILLAACVPIALVTNWVRVSALVLLAHHFGPEILKTSLHEGTGFAAFACALVVLFAIAGREILPDPDARPVSTPVSARFATPLALSCAIALLPVAPMCGLTTGTTTARILPRSCPEPASTIPSSAPRASARCASPLGCRRTLVPGILPGPRRRVREEEPNHRAPGDGRRKRSTVHGTGAAPDQSSHSRWISAIFLSIMSLYSPVATCLRLPRSRCSKPPTSATGKTIRAPAATCLATDAFSASSAAMSCFAVLQSTGSARSCFASSETVLQLDALARARAQLSRIGSRLLKAPSRDRVDRACTSCRGCSQRPRRRAARFLTVRHVCA
jgi:exosortase